MHLKIFAKSAPLVGYMMFFGNGVFDRLVQNKFTTMALLFHKNQNI